MPPTFKVYTTPTHIPGIGGRPSTPTDPWLQPHEFHSYIPALSAEEIHNLDEVLAYGAPVHGVTEDLERLFLTPSKRRVEPSTPEEAFEARKKPYEKPELRLRLRPSGLNKVQHLAVPKMNPDEEYTTFRRKTSLRGPVRVPLAELPNHEFAVWSHRSRPAHWKHPRATAPDAQRTPPAHSSGVGRQFNLATPPAQSTQVQVTPSTSNSSQSSSSVCSGCGLVYTCPRCSPNTSSRSSVPSSSSSQKSALSRSRAELDKNVRKMEGLAARGRKLRDIIPSMTAPSGVPKACRQKTEVEKWLEKEMATLG